MNFIEQACDEALTIFEAARQRLLDAIEEANQEEDPSIAPIKKPGLKPQVA